MRIDIHAHYMPPALAHDRDFFQREPYWEYLAQPSSAKSIQGWASPERMIEDMDRAQIDKIVLQGEYFHRHESAVSRNKQVVEILKRYSDRVMAFAALQPKAGARALDELKRCLDQGMCGVGEISPYAQGYALDDPDFLRMAEACIEHRIPLLLHTNEEVGRHYRGKVPTPLGHCYQLAARYPELKLILAHWGGGLIFYEMMPDARKTLQNVWYDTAASPLLFPTATIFDVALRCVDRHKLLYASDYPLLLYPRTQREPDMVPFLSEIEQLGLDSETSANIMGDNAAQLLGLIPAREPTTQTAARPAAAKERAPSGIKITEGMTVSWVAQAFAGTRAVFDKYQIPWQDCPVPSWEPIAQSACARGMSAEERQRLLEELNEATLNLTSSQK